MSDGGNPGVADPSGPSRNPAGVPAAPAISVVPEVAGPETSSILTREATRSRAGAPDPAGACGRGIADAARPRHLRTSWRTVLPELTRRSVPHPVRRCRQSTRSAILPKTVAAPVPLWLGFRTSRITTPVNSGLLAGAKPAKEAV